VLVGRSLGALVVLYVAALRPTSIAAMILVNFGAGVTLPEGFLERLVREPRLAIREMLLPMALPSFRRQLLGHKIEELLMDNRRVLYSDFMLLKGQRVPRMRLTGIPCLILTGLHDKIISPKAAQELRRVIKDSRLLILGDMGYFSQLEKPHLVHAIIEEFLEELKRKGRL
jgi:pimeloyl-ACP methyl ester carboxylesterase